MSAVSSRPSSFKSTCFQYNKQTAPPPSNSWIYFKATCCINVISGGQRDNLVDNALAEQDTGLQVARTHIKPDTTVGTCDLSTPTGEWVAETGKLPVFMFQVSIVAWTYGQ